MAEDQIPNASGEEGSEVAAPLPKGTGTCHVGDPSVRLSLPPFCRYLGWRASGEVPEWSNGSVSKTEVLARAPGVRIPPSPPNTSPCHEVAGLFRVRTSSLDLFPISTQRCRVAKNAEECSWNRHTEIEKAEDPPAADRNTQEVYYPGSAGYRTPSAESDPAGCRVFSARGSFT